MILGLLNILIGALNIVIYTHFGAWSSLLAGVLCVSCGVSTVIIEGVKNEIN